MSNQKKFIKNRIRLDLTVNNRDVVEEILEYVLGDSMSEQDYQDMISILLTANLLDIDLSDISNIDYQQVRENLDDFINNNKDLRRFKESIRQDLHKCELDTMREPMQYVSMDQQRRLTLWCKVILVAIRLSETFEEINLSENFEEETKNEMSLIEQGKVGRFNDAGNFGRFEVSEYTDMTPEEIQEMEGRGVRRRFYREGRFDVMSESEDE